MIKKITLLSLLSLLVVTSSVFAGEEVLRGGRGCEKENREKCCEKENLEKCCEVVIKKLVELDRGSNKTLCKLDVIIHKLCQDLGVDWATLCSLIANMDTLTLKVDTLQSTLDGLILQLAGVIAGTTCVNFVACPA